MRLLVTGSRNWTDRAQIAQTLRGARYMLGGTLSGYRPVVLVHGGCNMRKVGERWLYRPDPPRGADAIADAIWREWGQPVEVHPADWDRHGKPAGFIRNAEMVDAGADLVCAFRLDHSRGTTHTIDLAQKAGLRVMVIDRRTEAAQA